MDGNGSAGGAEGGAPEGAAGAESGRWARLAADLEAQADAWAIAERAGEVAERIRAETGRLRMVDRLRSSERRRVSIACQGGLRVIGQIAESVSDAVVISEDGGREAIVALGHVLAVSGLGALAADPGSAGVLASRIGLRHLARAVARDRSVVRVHLADGSVLDGTLDRVGADFLELALHAAGESRRRGSVRGSVVVPVAGVVALRRDAA